MFIPAVSFTHKETENQDQVSDLASYAVKEKTIVGRRVEV